jgi:hypothetical protein
VRVSRSVVSRSPRWTRSCRSNEGKLNAYDRRTGKKDKHAAFNGQLGIVTGEFLQRATRPDAQVRRVR